MGWRSRRLPRRPVWRRPAALIAAAVALAALTAMAAALVIRGSGGGLTGVQPNHLGVIDAETNEIVAEVTVGIRPGPVAADRHIIRVLDHGEDAGRLYIAFEYVEGGDLGPLDDMARGGEEELTAGPRRPARVVLVQMGQHHRLHVPRCDAGLRQGRRAARRPRANGERPQPSPGPSGR